MKKIAEAKRRDSLADALLADENWSSTSSALKTEALEAIRQRRRSLAFRNRVLRTSLAIMVLCAVGALAVKTSKNGQQFSSREMNPMTTQMVPLPVKASAEVPSEARDHYISEDQMLALFPPGSCVLAEINGRKELVFLETKIPKGEAN